MQTTSSFVLLIATLGLAAACGDDAPAPADPSPGMTVDSGMPDARAPDARPPTPSCTNHVKDGDETDVDCGGSCPVACELGKTCQSERDCAGSAACAALPQNDLSPEVRVCDRRVNDCSECGADLCRPETIGVADASIMLYCEKLAKLGAPCRTLDRDLGSSCEAGLACGGTQDKPSDAVCQPTLSAGAACYSEICGEGLGCVNHTCRALAAAGAPCLNDNECAHGLACNTFERVCRPRGHAGDACYHGEDSSDQCAPGLKCAFHGALVCTTWVDCGSQMDCCATPAGSECRVFDGRTHCQPPSGTCQ